MITEKHFTRVGLVALAIGMGVLGYRQMGAHADGIPGMSPMTYAGTLEEGSGPVTGTRNLRLTIYDVAVGGDSSNIRCVTPASGTAVTNGRFQVTLDNTCTAAVRSTPDLWLEVEVGGVSIGRTKISAVPFAVEAGRSAGLTPAASNALVPTGTVVAFAGTFARIPTGWLPCDGRSLARATYPVLFDAIGTAHGGDGTNFNLPDYRGRFLRGVDGSAGRDPDAAARGAANAGGNAGNAVGTLEAFATAMSVNAFGIAAAGSHSHTQVAHNHSSGAGIMFITQTGGPGILQGGGTYGHQSTTDSQAPTINEAGSHSHAITGGDRETRPINVAVNYIIKF